MFTSYLGSAWTYRKRCSGRRQTLSDRTTTHYLVIIFYNPGLIRHRFRDPMAIAGARIDRFSPTQAHLILPFYDQGEGRLSGSLPEVM